MANTANTAKRFPGDYITEGRLTKEPSKKTAKNGEEFIVFDIACNIGYGENQETTFFSCSAFGQIIKLIEKAKKGSFVHVVGELSIETYQKNDGSSGTSYRIRCERFRFLNTGNGEKKQEGQQYNSQQSYQQGQRQQYAPQGQQYTPQGQQYAPQGQQYAPQGQYSDYPDDFGMIPADGDLPF